MRQVAGSCVVVAVIAMMSGWQGARAATESAAPSPPSTAASAASAAHALVQRVLKLADHRQMPFAVVDKQSATITVYRADGSVAGVSTVLLGRTPGDAASMGVGERAQTGSLRLDDLTTPAGRFTTVPGRNLAGDTVVWMDYANALAIHRLRPAPADQQRPRRMASVNPRDKRISAGCVVVPGDFFDAVVQPVLGHGQGVVYVMPEDSSRWHTLWPAGAPAPVAL